MLSSSFMFAQICKCQKYNFWPDFVVLLKSDLDAQHTGLRGGLVEPLISITSVTKNHSNKYILDLVTAKAEAKLELLFNKPA